MRGWGKGDGCLGICAKFGFGLAQALREAGKTAAGIPSAHASRRIPESSEHTTAKCY